MSKTFCYKFVSKVLEVDNNNAYKKPLIENYGFMPVQETFEDEKGNKIDNWTGIWAKSIEIDKDSPIAKWTKKKIERIYKKESKNPDSTWVKDAHKAGYRFDKDGKLKENKTYLSGLSAQLCVSAEEPYAGTLYINMEGSAEFYNTDAVIDACPDVVQELLNAGVIYKTFLKVKKHKTKPKFVKYEEPEKKAKKPKKNTQGRFIVKTPNGYFVDVDKYSSIKEKAMVITDFKAAKKLVKLVGGKVIAL